MNLRPFSTKPQSDDIVSFTGILESPDSISVNGLGKIMSRNKKMLEPPKTPKSSVKDIDENLFSDDVPVKTEQRDTSEGDAHMESSSGDKGKQVTRKRKQATNNRNTKKR